MSKYHLFLVDEVDGLHNQLHELVCVGAPLVQVLQGVLGGGASRGKCLPMI